MEIDAGLDGDRNRFRSDSVDGHFDLRAVGFIHEIAHYNLDEAGAFVQQPESAARVSISPLMASRRAESPFDSPVTHYAHRGMPASRSSRALRAPDRARCEAFIWATPTARASPRKRNSVANHQVCGSRSSRARA